ncbi:hypothetical protein H8356DRAFT_1383809 [Neocallimastix lanati (nom. inval.)]|uniref:Uncharacterized protein n=1 Tax=Neocallimastix californiae TaxID=1754190 RepID=A0A1Y1YH15_9FUNG|nr:hypothetical protein H8356DRAFT_1383809 [Neocallimastix sp. JGI-2020a]ORX97302.1 hypothetical protein LY90DRAFT_520109 [Neocallimastix californiae]|eukprot:ORX97302.1 hypothetical protein LY90DRAFT_520109 [Neocallimastix californiae]
MKLFCYFIFTFNYIYKIYCNLHNYGNEELSALILAAGLIDGNGNINIATINNRWIRVPNGQNQQGQQLQESIVNIVPSLRTQFYMHRTVKNWQIQRANAVNAAFANLYRLAMRTYDKYFNIKDDKGNLIPANDIINSYDLFRYLTTGGNGVPISLFDPTISKEIYYPNNDRINDDFIEFIKYKNHNEAWFKAKICKETAECKKYFEYHNTDIGTNYFKPDKSDDNNFKSEVNFNIVKTVINGETRYHLFTADNKPTTGQRMAQ